MCKVWDEQGPFDGLLGFSQGAAMVSVFQHCVFGKGAAVGGGLGEGGVVGDFCNGDEAVSAVERCGLGVG